MPLVYKFKILIVDDNPKFIESFKTILNFYFKDRIYSIDTVNNAKECLSALKKKKIDIVFMDYDIPGINGAELTNLINSEFRFVKVIAVSFHKEKHILNSMILSGARDYISKEEINKESIERCLTKQLV
jgi:CheY-like chemotaxis protein